ncbi:MAG: MFS transporter [Bifidobacteriaceae bacterium]|jgi:NNP family nitrate/nitrite transporter-like MFS transporter|nr:MFS transporter [Bifidobacteriaceae bacterium]
MIQELPGRYRVMWLSTISFTLMFAVWLQFGILQSPISQEFHLSTPQVAWLVAVPSLNGSLWRLVTGLMADRWGGRVVMTGLMLVSAIPTFLVVFADSYGHLLLFAFLIGLSGNSFTVGTAWNSAWFPKQQQGLALGVFGAGNVGASVTKLIGPSLLAAVPGIGWLATIGLNNWRLVPVMYAIALIGCAALNWWLTPPADQRPGRGVPLMTQLRPLAKCRVWRFAFYYVVVFGGYVALSAWMPKFYTTAFGVSLGLAGLLTALFIFPASLLRPLGGWMSDRWGARPVLTASLLVVVATTVPMTMDLSVVPFTVLLVGLGVGMGIGKAAVYKHIPEYFPTDVGAVGGLVGMLGGLGAVAYPPLFAYIDAWFGVGIQAATFGTVAVSGLGAFGWMVVSIMRIKKGQTVLAGSAPSSTASQAPVPATLGTDGARPGAPIRPTD